MSRIGLPAFRMQLAAAQLVVIAAASFVLFAVGLFAFVDRVDASPVLPDAKAWPNQIGKVRIAIGFVGADRPADQRREMATDLVNIETLGRLERLPQLLIGQRFIRHSPANSGVRSAPKYRPERSPCRCGGRRQAEFAAQSIEVVSADGSAGRTILAKIG